MKRDSRSPRAYLDDVPLPQRELLDSIREVIARVAPDIEEGIEYGMLDYPGLANLAAQKNYVSLYVAADVLAEHRASFPGVNAGKSCLRFRRKDQADPDALERLLRDVREHRRSP